MPCAKRARGSRRSAWCGNTSPSTTSPHCRASSRPMIRRRPEQGGVEANMGATTPAPKSRRRSHAAAHPQRSAAAPAPRLHVPPAQRIGVAHLTAEYWPFARTGGLGEAVSGLATCQAAAGLPTTVIMPLYQIVRETTPSLERTGSPLAIALGGHTERAWLYRALPGPGGGPQVFFIEHPDFVDRVGIYGDNGGDYPDNARRVAFFCLAPLTALPEVAPGTRGRHAPDLAPPLAP